MPTGKQACPKCRTEMVRGFVLVKSPGRAVARTFEVVSMWIEGAPDKGWFGVRLKGKEGIEIATYKCSDCGYLESYAE